MTKRLGVDPADDDSSVQAAVTLALHFARWVDYTGAGALDASPEGGSAAGQSPASRQAITGLCAPEILKPFQRIADHLGLRTGEQRMALINLLCGLANMIGDQGADLEGVLSSILHPEDPVVAVVLGGATARQRTAELKDALVGAPCLACGGLGDLHRPGCSSLIKH